MCDSFIDNFETDLGWIVDPDETDTATSGRWERAIASYSYTSDGTMYQRPARDGGHTLVTGATTGQGIDSNDLDGLTTIRSPEIVISPSAQSATLQFDWYLAHTAASSNADSLTVRLYNADSEMQFSLTGAPKDKPAKWRTTMFDLSDYAGETVQIEIVAADADDDSIVEAAISNLQLNVSCQIDD